MSKTYKLTMSNSWCSGSFTVSNTTAGKVTVTVKLWRNDGGTSYNNNADDNFYIKIAGSTYYHTVTKVAGTSGTSFSSSKKVTLADDGTASVSIKVGGSLSGTTFKITGGNSKTYKITDGTVATYIIKYNANGGTGAPAQQTKTYNVALKLRSTIPTRASETVGSSTTTYVFKGWALSESALTYDYLAGATLPKTFNKPATLYAVWAAYASSSIVITTYDVIYYTNGGTSVAKQTKTKGTALTLQTTVPTRKGYVFSNWNTEEDGSGTSYSPGGTYSTDSDVILYAIWTPLTDTINFNANSGSDAPSTITITTGDIVYIPEDEPTKDGYIFRKWNTSADGSGTSYRPGDQYTVTPTGITITLYAIWAEIKISFHPSNDCKAVEFIEESGVVGFSHDGFIFVSEFIEGGTKIKLGTSNFTFNEIIER